MYTLKGIPKSLADMPALKRPKLSERVFVAQPHAPVLRRPIEYNAQVFVPQPHAPQLFRPIAAAVSPFDVDVVGGARKKRKKPVEERDKLWYEDPLFGTLVAFDKNTELRFYLTNRELKRSKDFNIQKVLFEFSVQTHPSKALPINVVQRCVTQAVANGLRRIQTMYTERPGITSTVFAVITDTDRKLKHGSGKDKIKPGDDVVIGQTHATQTGRYRLWDNADETAEKMLENLAAYMRSNASFNIRFGFYMSLTVVHTHDKVFHSNDGNVVGARTESSFLSDYGLRKTGRCTYETPKELENMCLPVSLLFGYCNALQNSYRILTTKKKQLLVLNEDEQTCLDKLNESTYRKLFSRIQRTAYDTNAAVQNANENRKQAYALRQLKSALNELLVKTGLQNCTSFNYADEGVKIADYLKLQFCVYSRVGNKMIFKYPQQKNMSLPVIMLYYQTYSNKKVGHISLILKLTFFEHKYICPFCNKSVLHQQKRHWCENSCKACKGYMRNDGDRDLFFNKTNLLMCDRRSKEQKSTRKCPKCRTLCYSDNCLEVHLESSVCSNGFVCETCNFRGQKTATVNTYEAFKKTHECFMILCKLCWEKYDERKNETHYCFLRSIKRQKYFPNLAFFDTETVALDESPEGCKECVKKEVTYLSAHNVMHLSKTGLESFCIENDCYKDIRCDKHVNTDVTRDYHNVNALSFYYEDKKPGHFSRVAMYSPQLNMPDDCQIEEDILVSDYTTPDLNHNSLTFEVQRKRNGQFARKTKTKNDVENIASCSEDSSDSQSDIEYCDEDDQRRRDEDENADDDEEEEEEEGEDFDDDIIEYITNDDTDEEEQERTAEDLTIMSDTDEEEIDEERESDREFIDDKDVVEISTDEEYNEQEDEEDEEDEEDKEDKKSARVSSCNESESITSVSDTDDNDDKLAISASDDDGSDDGDSDDDSYGGDDDGNSGKYDRHVPPTTRILRSTSRTKKSSFIPNKEQQNLNSKEVKKKTKAMSKKTKATPKNIKSKTPILRLITGKKDKSNTPIQKFLMFILQERFRNYVIFSHNGQSFDHQLIVEEAYNIGLTPTLLTNGQKVLTIVFPEFNIRFLDFMLYKSGSLASLAASQKIPQQKIDFPYMFNRPENYNYSGSIPDNKYFGKAFETSEQTYERNCYLNRRRELGEVWNFKDKLRTYVHSDVHILTILATKFAEECFRFQKLCTGQFFTQPVKNDAEKQNQQTKQSKSKKAEKRYLHPYGQQFLTISGYTYGTYRFFQLKKYNLYVIPDEKGSGRINTSKKEGEWAQWYQHILPDHTVESFFTTDKIPTVKETRPDLLIKSTKTVGNFRGCVIHGHFDANGNGCELLKGKTLFDKNIYQQSYHEMMKKHDRHKARQQEMGYTNEVVMYEVCHYYL